MRRLIAIALLWFLCCGFGPGWQKPPLGAQLNRSHPLAPNIGIWAMNENSGSVINNAVGNIGIGKSSKTVWIPQGLGFKSTLPSLVELLNFYGFASNQPHTVFAIIRPTGSNVSVVGLTSAGSKGNALFVNAAMCVRIIVAAGEAIIDGVTPMPVGVISSIAFTWRASGLGTVYLNGKLDGSNVKANTWITPSLIGRIGAYHTGDAPYDGSILYVWIDNRALIDSEILWLHSQPYAMFQRPILSRQYLNFGTGGAVIPPVGRKGQAIILGKAGKNDIIAWAKEGTADDYYFRKAANQ